MYTDAYQQFRANSSKPPPVEFHKVELQVVKVYKDTNTGVITREKLEDETIEFDRLLGHFLMNIKKLTSIIAETPALAGEPSVQSQVQDVEAMSVFLDKTIGDMAKPIRMEVLMGLYTRI